jgi:hypothetical protein
LESDILGSVMWYFTDDSFAADQEFPDIKFRINKKHTYAIFEYFVRYMEEIDDILKESVDCYYLLFLIT